MLRVFVVSPLPAVRAGLRALLEGAGDLAVVGEATGVGPLPQPDVPGAAVDVIVLDGLAPLEASDLADDRAGAPAEAAVVVLGPAPDGALLPAPTTAPAWAYLAREASVEQIVAAVRAVGAGLVAIDPRAGRHLLAPATSADTMPDGNEGGATEDLTPREREVLQLVAQGLPNKHIARRLGISEHTVKFHVAAVLAKLGAGSRTEAVHLAARRGLVAL